MRRSRRPTSPAATAVLLVVAFAAVAAGVVIDKPARADGPKPLERDCHLEGGVRFCGGAPNWTGGGRVGSWDGFPLDVDVTLPPTGDGPWPTLVMLHPWGTSKTLFEATSPGRGRTAMMGNQYNNNNFARQGYLVVNFTSRGIFGSFGAVLGDVLLGNGLGTIGCPDDDFLHFADTRYAELSRDRSRTLGVCVQGREQHRCAGRRWR